MIGVYSFNTGLAIAKESGTWCLSASEGSLQVAVQEVQCPSSSSPYNRKVQSAPCGR